MTDKRITYASGNFSSSIEEPAASSNAESEQPADDILPTFLDPDRESADDDSAAAIPPGAFEPRVGRRSGIALFAAAAVALAATAWYVGINGMQSGPAEQEVAASDPVETQARARPRPAMARPALREIELPRIGAATAASLGNVEFDVTPEEHYRYVRVENGDTLISVLTRAGATHREAFAVTASLSGVFDPRRLRPGRRMAIVFGLRGNTQGEFLGLRFDSSYDRTVSVQRQADGSFIATELRKQLTTELVRGDGIIRTSLFQAGLRNGVPAASMIRLIHLFSFDVDFQRDIHRDDSFEIMFMRHRNSAGQVVRNGEVAYASLTLNGTTHRLYRFTTPEGRTGYFDGQGRGLRKALMRTPIDGARLSSNYGRRRHPILGYTRMHTGVDFAAPRGTPIYAAGDGTVVYAGRRGGYGNYIRIRHTRNYQTAYAHMRGFADGVRRGSRVRQGQVIGYVGSTGRSTGPHLHYEVIYNGRHINPMTLDLPSNQILEGEALERFQAYREEMDERFAELERSGETQIIAARSDHDLSICVNGRRLDPTDGRPCPAEAAGTQEAAATSRED